MLVGRVLPSYSAIVAGGCVSLAVADIGSYEPDLNVIHVYEFVTRSGKRSTPDAPRWLTVLDNKSVDQQCRRLVRAFDLLLIEAMSELQPVRNAVACRAALFKMRTWIDDTWRRVDPWFAWCMHARLDADLINATVVAAAR